MENPIPIRLPLILDTSSQSFMKGKLSAVEDETEPSEGPSFSEVLDFCKKQTKIKASENAEYFVIDRMKSLSEYRSAVIACKKVKLPIYVSVTVDEYGFNSQGTPALAFLISMQDMGITAFGINCSDAPEEMLEILKGIAPYSKIPLIADFSETEPRDIVKFTPMFLEYGVQVIIGNFKNHSMQLKALTKILNGFDFNNVLLKKQDTSLILASETQVFFLSADGIESSEPITCSVDMADELIELSGTNIDVITVEILSSDDAYRFSQNAHMAGLPVMFKSDDERALKAALLMYHGRAMLDSSCGIDTKALNKIAAKYGAVVY